VFAYVLIAVGIEKLTGRIDEAEGLTLTSILPKVWGSVGGTSGQGLGLL
jgi:hypothetical protein